MSYRLMYCFLSASFLLHAGPVVAASITVGGAGCQFSSIQAAIDLAASTPEADVIRIAGNAAYQFQALNKHDPYPLDLVGGFPDCLPLSTPNGQTWIHGNGVAAPVLSVHGGHVGLTNLVFTGGAPLQGRGGGVSVGASTRRISLQNVRITGNAAREGGGLAIAGSPNNTVVLYSQRLVIDHNYSAVAGGGLWATYAQATKHSAAWRITDNETRGDGGGAWLGRNAVMHLFSSKDPTGFVGNLAKGNGGGVALVRGGSLVLFHDGGPAQATEISDNTAAQGGGIYLHSDVAGTTSIQMHNVVGNGNLALQEGGFAAIRMSGDDGDLRVGELHVDASTFFGGATCSEPLDCNVFKGNAAISADGQLQPGALVSIRNSGRSAVGMARFWNATVRESRGRDLVSHESDAKSGYAEEFEFRDSLVVRNIAEKHLIETVGDGALHIFGSTFARNESGAATLQVDTATSNAYIYGSIFDDRAALMDQVPPSHSLFALMVREPGATDGMPLIERNDPLFEDADGDDFRLRAGSPALDRQWDLAPQNGLDRAGNPRTVDLAAVPDFNTPRDLGCFEHP